MTQTSPCFHFRSETDQIGGSDIAGHPILAGRSAIAFSLHSFGRMSDTISLYNRIELIRKDIRIYSVPELCGWHRPAQGAFTIQVAKFSHSALT
ncbi:hypothetical protein Bind_1684 [Beijerinckia indica subsp. indica ATCC 9039]|uniref:Uncharacterized protein n=1 Tax=Beijerinckia indica subsp. indica (strain ATCC 9039 / DSM 1715 / NCIMB 8712) TaxID=395963 RepID=B2IBY5_BEII9|nr:hypothetical protein Bind_1684 [Beijerinckia indica subsp. indica ATCC 9039]